MLKTAIYVDAENIKMSGGFGMRYDVLVDLANSGNCTMLRANCYLSEDHERIKSDADYRQKIYTYHNILRQCGFRIIKKYVRRYRDEEGNITTKANSDMDLAIDALLQSKSLDRIILLTGDSDFVRLIPALQNEGCRVEVIGFNNVAKELREVADSFISGFLIPGLLPFADSGREEEDWLRGVVSNFNPDRGFGFFRYYRLDSSGLHPESVFFHLSQSTLHSEHVFQEAHRIFEFRIVEDSANGNRSEAREIRLLRDN
ncbi:MAG: NYN domain-containing protein [Desulfobulbaceae bacterium]|nr:NYN domain-containing protein [Desulfobulbaceae bacterium]